MYPRLILINLGGDNLDRSLSFYRDGLGFPTQGIVGAEFHDEVTGADGSVVFFELEGGIMFSLYERDNLAKDASVILDPPSSTEFSLVA